MIQWCAYCSLDTAGQHEQGCPNHPDSIAREIYLKKWYPTDVDRTKEWLDGVNPN